MSSQPPLPDMKLRYEALAGRLPDLARTAPVTLCGMSACIDARLDMSAIGPLLEAQEPPEASALARLLLERAASGIGGEVRVDWPEGPAWLTERLAPRTALGGVGPQAGWVLATLGAAALVNLEDRSAHMLAHLPPRLLLAQAGEAVRADAVIPHGERRPDIFIFEYTAGVPVGPVVPARSSRIIVRFGDPGLDRDEAFEALSERVAATAGAGLVAGFNGVAPAELDGETARIFALTRRWQAVGLRTVHMEMSGFADPTSRDTVLAAARGAVSSIGMSLSEFDDLAGPWSGSVAFGRALAALGERLECERVCVHADHWAASATLGDPGTELDALMTGCLVASARSAAGVPVMPHSVPEGARFHPSPFEPGERLGRWHLVSCPSPYLAQPATTLGLGDSFTGGCLLILGAAASRAAMPVRRSA